MKKVIVSILALVMIFSLIACARRKTPSTLSAAGSSDVTSLDTEDLTTSEVTTPQSSVIDTEPSPPPSQYNGMKYRVSTKLSTASDEVFVSDESVKTDMELAVLQRNAAVEDEYDISIVPVYASDNALNTQVNAIIGDVVAGMDTIDAAYVYAAASTPLISNCVVYDLKEWIYIRLSEEYWLPELNKELQFCGKQYIAVNEAAVSVKNSAVSIFMNRTLSDAYDITDDVLGAVTQNSWTFDTFMSTLSVVSDSIDSDGSDTYGFMSETVGSFNAWISAFDVDMLEWTDNNTLSFVFGNERANTAVEKIRLLISGNVSVDTRTYPNTAIENGNAVFCGIPLKSAIACMNGSTLTDDYTAIPYPLLDDAQEKYSSAVIDSYNVFIIPITCRNTGMTTKISNALAEGSAELVAPAFRSSVLSVLKQDTQTALALDLVLDGIRVSLVDVLITGKNAKSHFVSAINTESKDFREYLTSTGVDEILQAQLTALIDDYNRSLANFG